MCVDGVGCIVGVVYSVSCGMKFFLPEGIDSGADCSSCVVLYALYIMISKA